MSEEEVGYIKLLIQKRLFQNSINRLSKKLEEIEREMEHFDIFDWWDPIVMCHNHEECGDNCDSCDMPKIMWKDRKKILRARWL